MTNYEKYLDLMYNGYTSLSGQARVDFLKSVIDDIKEQGKKDGYKEGFARGVISKTIDKCPYCNNLYKKELMKEVLIKEVKVVDVCKACPFFK